MSHLSLIKLMFNMAGDMDWRAWKRGLLWFIVVVALSSSHKFGPHAFGYAASKPVRQWPPHPMLSLKKIAESSTNYGSHLGFSPDGHLLAVVNSAGALYLWRNLVPWQSQSYPGERLDRTFFSPTGDQVLVAPQVFQVATQQWLPLPSITPALLANLPTKPTSGDFAVHASAWSPDGQDLVVYGEYRASRGLGDRTTWNGPTKRLLLLEGQSRKLRTILWQGNSHEAYRVTAINAKFIASAATQVQVWDRLTQHPVANLAGHSTVVRDLQWNDAGTLLASGGTDQQVILWDTKTWKPRHQWQAHQGEVKSMAFHPHRPLLVTGGEDQQLKFWSLEGHLLKTEPLQGMVEGLAFNPQGDRIAIALGGPHATVQVYQLEVP
jgi:WD40 repeat protein